jgi:hypothetical protein
MDLKYLQNINTMKQYVFNIDRKYYIYITFIILFIYIIYSNFEENYKYEIILPQQYIFHTNKNNDYNNNDIFFTMDNYRYDIPSKIDLRSKCPPVYDQGKLGLCHINAACFVYRYICLNNNIDFNPSRMFCEYNMLHLKNNLLNKISINNRIYQYDLQGATNVLEDINTFLLYGTCEENEYPYPTEEEIEHNKNIIDQIDEMKNNIYSEKNLINISEKYKEIKIKAPTKDMYINAQNHKILDAYKLNNDISEIKKYLNNHGPVLFGYKNAGNVVNIMKYQKYLEILNIILNKENNLDDSDKNSINEYINILNKYIKKNDYKFHFMSYYDEINNVKLSSNVQNLMDKYSNKYHKEIFKKIFKNSNKNELTLRFPHKLINESEKYLKDNGIDLDNIKNNMLFFEENNLPDNYLNDYKNFINNKLEKINYGKQGRDVYNFIKETDKFNGHIMTIVGYDDNDETFIISNSWGDYWGDNGYFYMDYEFFNNKNPLWGNKIVELYCLHNTTDGNI